MKYEPNLYFLVKTIVILHPILLSLSFLSFVPRSTSILREGNGSLVCSQERVEQL
jgi:hypothetical protein